MKRIGGRLARCTFVVVRKIEYATVVRTFAACVRKIAESCPKISGDELTQIFGSAPADRDAGLAERMCRSSQADGG